MKKLAAFVLVALVVATSLLALAGKQRAWTQPSAAVRQTSAPDTEDVLCAGEHTGKLAYGDLHKGKNGFWYQDVFCSNCGEFVNANLLEGIPTASGATTLHMD